MPPAPRFTMTERELFRAVLDLPDPAAHAGYLGQACAGDAALRGRVEALLRSHGATGTFLAVPAVTPPDPAHTRSVADALTATGDTAPPRQTRRPPATGTFWGRRSPAAASVSSTGPPTPSSAGRSR